jgi:hypothetical protein
MEKIIVKKGEPIRIVVQPKKIEIVEHKIVNTSDTIPGEPNTSETEEQQQ